MLARGLHRAAAACGTAVVALLGAAPALAEWKLNMHRGVTPISAEAYDLHMMVLWVCVAIGAIVFGVMLVSIVLHRKARGHQAAQFHHSTKAEIVWTVIPVLILVAMAIPATGALMRIDDTSRADLTVNVTGIQWKWRYEYVDQGVSFYSSLARTSMDAMRGDPSTVENYLLEVDHPLVVPVGAKIRFTITALDVIHAWWVPALGMKKDAIPGYVTEMWARIDKPGIYRGQCAELCGAYHGYMPIVVDARSPDDFAAWLAERQRASGGQPVPTAVSAAFEIGG